MPNQYITTVGYYILQTTKSPAKQRTVQVLLPAGQGFLLKKSYRYPTADSDKYRKAIDKAVRWAQNHQPTAIDTTPDTGPD